MIDDILTLAEAAELLGRSPTTLRAQAVAGRLKARLVGKTWVTTKAEVERYRRENLGNVGRPPNVGPEPGLTKGRAEAPIRRKWSDIKRAKGAPG
jgi:hypothetical protein